MEINHIKIKSSEIDSIDIESIKNYKATLIKGLQFRNKLDFVLFANNFGNILPYGQGAIHSFKGITSKEIELHYDGISSSVIDKLPYWLIFLAKKCTPKNLGGRFKILDSEKILQELDENLINLLNHNKLRFFGYFSHQIEAKAYKDFSFEINPIQKFDDRESLRLFLPSLINKKNIEAIENNSFKSETCSKFTNKSFYESNAIFDNIREKIYSSKSLVSLNFDNNDILILDNRFTLHGREAYTKPVERVLDRIQVLKDGTNKYSLNIQNYKEKYLTIEN